MNRFIWLVALTLVAPSLSASLLKKEQGYDKPIFFSERTPTSYIDSDRIFLLSDNSRPPALQMLSGKKVLEINETQSAALLGGNIDTDELLDVLAKKIDEHVQRRQKALEKTEPQASFWDFLGKNDDLKRRELAQELIRLDMLHADYVRSLKGRLKPYLISIQAPPVAGLNVSGWIEKNDLHFMSVQFGNYSEVATLPFIVFLEFVPKAVIPHRLTFR